MGQLCALFDDPNCCYQKLFEGSKDLVFVCEAGPELARTRLIEVNAATCRGLSLPAEQLQQQTLSQLVAEGEQGLLALYLEQLNEAGELDFETRLRSGSGAWLTVELHAQLVAGKGGAFAVVVGRDSTRSRETEMRARLLAGIVEQTPDAIICGDKRFVFTYANEMAAKLTGWTRTELIGKTPFDLAAEPEVEAIQAQMERILATGKVFEKEVTSLRKDGSIFIAQVRVAALRDESAQVIGYMCSLRDISPQRRREAERAQADLTSTVSLLAKGLGHEVNNPLTYTLFNLERLEGELPQLAQALGKLRADLGDSDLTRLLGEQAAALDDERLDALVARVHSAVEGATRVRDVVRELQTFSRSDDESLVAVSLQHVIDSALNMARSEIEARAKIARDYGEVPLLAVNDARLAQVFLNLLVNAAQAMDGDPAENEISIRTWCDEDVAYAEVADNGPGIPEEHRQRIFEPFFTTKAAGVGSGLGLAVCRNIVGRYGGDLRVECEEGEGCRFIVALPLSPQR